MRSCSVCRFSLSLLALVFGVSVALAVDNQPPLCTHSISGSGATATVDGKATDKGSSNSGIVSVVLDPSSVNVTCDICPFDLSPDSTNHVSFSIGFDPSLDLSSSTGNGLVIATDVAGNSCIVGASFVPLDAGSVINVPLVLDSGNPNLTPPHLGMKLNILDGTAIASDVAVTGYSLAPEDDRCLPACFEFQPDSQVLTLESPIEGDTTASLDTPGNNNVRMLFRHPNECPYVDLSESIQALVFDPRVKGKGMFSTVLYATGRQIDGCIPDQQKKDVDKDQFPASEDCNDANPLINPGATEVCNGIDDDCDELVDEGGNCGTVEITAFLHIKGGDGGSTKDPMPGTEVRIYDVVDPCVAPLVDSPSQACELYGSGTFEDPGCVAVSTALTDAEGKAVFGVPGGAEYYVVGKPPAPNEENKISHTVGFVSGGAFVRKQIQLIIDPLTGEEVPSRNCE